MYWAFQVNYRRARAYEQVTVRPLGAHRTPSEPSRPCREWTLNPLWVRLDRVVHAEFGIERLFLVSHGRRFAIAAFLGPQEKESFAVALSAALGEAKRGPTRTNSASEGQQLRLPNAQHRITPPDRPSRLPWNRD